MGRVLREVGGTHLHSGGRPCERRWGQDGGESAADISTAFRERGRRGTRLGSLGAALKNAIAKPRPWRQTDALNKPNTSRKGTDSVRGYKVLGVTRDGVRILTPRWKATHFTQKELREALAYARSVRPAE